MDEDDKFNKYISKLTLDGYKFLRKKYPNIKSHEVCSMLDMISTVNLLYGMYSGATAKEYEQRFESKICKLRYPNMKAAYELQQQSMEDMAHPNHSLYNFTKDFFGIDLKDHPKFDLINLKDGFHWRPEIKKLFKKAKKK